MKILITGIHGFVGSNLAAAFGNKFMIYGLDIISPPARGVIKTFGWNELEQIPPVDLIIHLAGLAHDTKRKNDSKKYYEVNVGLTKVIFRNFLKSGAGKFIFFSSVKAAADSVKEGTLTEDFIPDPQTAYGKSKLEAERHLMANPVPEHKKVYILRPCLIHGPGSKGNFSFFSKYLKTGLPFPLGDFNNKRSFTSMVNLCFIIEQLIEKNIPSGIYNVADDEPLSTNELIRIISSGLGKKPRILRISRKIIRHAATLGDTCHLPFNNEILGKLTDNYAVSNNKLIAALGTSLPVSAREGLFNTFAGPKKELF